MSRGAFGMPERRPVPSLHRNWANAIARRSRVLTSGQKVVFSRLLELDRSAAGVYVSPEHLADDVGMPVDSCRKIRRELHALGLLHLERVRTATGTREFWYCRLPFALDTAPRNARAWLADWANTLDRELAAKNAVASGKICQTPQQKTPSAHVPTLIKESDFPVLVSQTKQSVSNQSVKYSVSTPKTESESRAIARDTESENVKGGIPNGEPDRSVTHDWNTLEVESRHEREALANETLEQRRERFRLQIAAQRASAA